MTLNEKIISYKILYLVNIYNFGIKFEFIRNHMKKYELFCVTFVGEVHAITRP